MKFFLAFIALLTSATVIAAPPSDASIERLMVVTNAESLFDKMFQGYESSIRESLKSATSATKLSAQQRQALDQAPVKIVAILRDEFKGAALKSMYTQIYRETFDQEEVDGLLAFYESPAGRAAVAKMPVVIEQSMAISQSRIKALMPKIQAAISETLKEAGVR